MARTTIRDVAKLARVSVGTVSNVLNQSGRVRSETRLRVEDAIHRLGYRPNAIAQSLISRRAQSAGRPATSNPGAPHLSTFGYLSVDYTAKLDVLPHRDDRISAHRIEKSLGGPAANVAVMATTIGPPWTLDCELVTKLGYDADSDWALEQLHTRGVTTIGISRQPDLRLSRCIVLVEANGARTIINEPLILDGADFAGALRTKPDNDRVHALHVEGFQIPYALNNVADAHAKGWRTNMHAAGLPPTWQTEAALAHMASAFDLIFLNRDIVRAMTDLGRNTQSLIPGIAALAERTCPRTTLVVNLDEDGAVLFAPGRGGLHVPAPRIRIVDTTGAGDALAGAFLAVTLNGGSDQTALEYGVAAASAICEIEGAQPKGTTTSAIRRWLRDIPPVRQLRHEAV